MAVYLLSAFHQFHCDLGPVPLDDGTLEVHFLCVSHITRVLGVKGLALGLDPLLLRLTEVNGGLAVNGHLRVRAHGGCLLDGDNEVVLHVELQPYITLIITCDITA